MEADINLMAEQQGDPRSNNNSAAPPLVEPRLLRVLVVDSKGSSRTAVCSLLRDCEYQASAPPRGGPGAPGPLLLLPTRRSQSASRRNHKEPKVSWRALAASPAAPVAAVHAAIAAQPMLARLLGRSSAFPALDLSSVVRIMAGPLKVRAEAA